tara:strand:- start:227 stop:943 length:717 start_codon:yes stop_codon:yes gene_type:complete
MPTAQPFNALGKGNGFNRCLTTTATVPDDRIINAPTFEQVVGAYWNFHSASFSGASFEPTNEDGEEVQPSDLICNPFANAGFDRDFTIGPPSKSFRVSNGSPRIVKDAADDETIYYKHGISFRYTASEDIDGGNGVKITNVYYGSTIAVDVSPIPYSCTVLSTTTSGGGSYSIGKLASQRKVNVSSVDIGGLPFVKTVVQDFSQETYDDPVGSGNAKCASASFFPETSETPSLTFWDY